MPDRGRWPERIRNLLSRCLAPTDPAWPLRAYAPDRATPRNLHPEPAPPSDQRIDNYTPASEHRADPAGPVYLLESRTLQALRRSHFRKASYSATWITSVLPVIRPELRRPEISRPAVFAGCVGDCASRRLILINPRSGNRHPGSAAEIEAFIREHDSKLKTKE
jgi:hypothetical protein